ncbi:hypothetical protein DD592_26570 [Enterobacter cloacae complex sp. 2DZ2F20B]|nr:hypothetical protein DD592_26570 [Enterobacter cloacae complex sp. 2DZ2F20B]
MFLPINVMVLLSALVENNLYIYTTPNITLLYIQTYEKECWEKMTPINIIETSYHLFYAKNITTQNYLAYKIKTEQGNRQFSQWLIIENINSSNNSKEIFDFCLRNDHVWSASLFLIFSILTVIVACWDLASR